MDVPLPPLLPGLFPTSNNMIRGSGILSWLSPKAGLINCSKPMCATVSFQIKDFCDSGVTDLTQYLRVGFRLAFHAIPNNTNEWIANYVSPINEQDLANGVVNDGQELNLESIEQNNMPPGKAGKDTYSLEKEMRALAFLLSIFQKNSVHYIPLSNLHSRISNSGDQELSRYIGSSSLKRRQFIEDRSYIFQLADNDVVYLQMPEVYHTVMQLAGFLLTHGGVTSSDLLFTFFNKSSAIPSQIKENIQNPLKAGRQQFMQFLSRHPFAFAPFPSQYYVGVRRNLPFFDYATFFRRVRESHEKKMPSNGLFPHPQSFPNFHSSRPVSRPLLQSNAESFESQLSPVDVPVGGGGGLAAALSGGGGLAPGHGLGGLVNGFGGTGGGTLLNGHGHHAGIGNGVGGLNGSSTSKSLAQQFIQMRAGGGGGGAVADTTSQQKPLFSLFDDPILPSPGGPASAQTSSIQNGVRSIVGGSGGASGPGSLTNGSGGIDGIGQSSTGTNNIWKYDMDFFDGSKITDVFSANFQSMLSLGDPRASPPRKQFVEREVQTDESSFGTNATGESVCTKCAMKMCDNNK